MFYIFVFGIVGPSLACGPQDWKFIVNAFKFMNLSHLIYVLLNIFIFNKSSKFCLSEVCRIMLMHWD